MDSRDEEAIGRMILSSAMKVHSLLGCGLLESAYEACLVHELVKLNLKIARQVAQPVKYDGVSLDVGYRLDVLVEDKVVIEVKAVEKLSELHLAQILSYLKLGGYRLGYLLNFNVLRMKDGIKRVVNNL
jgi:GxxExxY protein